MPLLSGREKRLETVLRVFPDRVFDGLPEWLCDFLGSFRPLGREEFDLEIFRGAEAGFTEEEFMVVADWAEGALLQALMLQLTFSGRLKIGRAQGGFKLVWSPPREKADEGPGKTPPPALRA